MLKLKMDCPYCDSPMKVELKNLSPNGCHYLRHPYNIPETWNYEGYSFRCSNGHAHVTIDAHEFYYWQHNDLEKFKKLHDEYQGPRTPHGYKAIGFGRQGGFEGTVQITGLSLGYPMDKNKHVSFTASPGETPYIYVYYYGNPYMEQFTIQCTEEWLSWSPNKIIQMMKLTMQEHATEFNKHFEGCEEWDD